MKRISLYIFYALLAYMPLHIFFSTWVGTSFGILDFAKVFKDIVLVVGFLLALVVAARQKWFSEILQDKILWLISAYAFLTLLLALKPTDQDAEILGIVFNVRYLLFFIYGALLAKLYAGTNVLRTALKIVLAVSVIVLIFGIVQYTLLPDSALKHVGYSRKNGVLPAFFIDDKPDLERVMSTLRDPNSFGSYVIIILSLVLAYWLKTKNKDLKKLLLGVGLLAGMCLVFTFSRSAWIGAVLAACVLLARHYKNQKNFMFNKKYLLPLIALLAICLMALFPLRNTYFIQNVVFHADESTVLEDPNELRARFWQESIDAAFQQPLGYGPGTAGLASIRNQAQGTVLNENYYLQILYEVGVLGLILFLAILFLTMKRLWDLSMQNPAALALFAAGIGLLFTNFLVHIWSNEAVAYTWWGLAGLVLFSARKKRA